MKKKIMLIFLPASIIIVLLVGLLKVSETHKQAYKNEVGSKIIFKKDTVIVVNYSLLNGSFTLSNRREVSYDFVIINKVK